MASKIVRFCLVAGYLALRASAACAVYGVDYSNGGSYNIDPSSDDSFTFTTIFQTCVQESIKPVLVDPTGHQYTCSAINTTPDGQEQKSTCGIRYSSMSSGQWKIVISGTNVAVQRIINLTMVSPSTVTVTATPTVIVGITSTPNPTTVFSTIGTQTQTLILQPGTVTTPCVGSTTTLTVTPTKATYVTVSTVVRTTTDATVTRESTTTVVKTAYCHYTDDFPAPPPNTICIGLACGYPPDLPTPTVCVGFSCSKPAAQTGNVPDTPTTSSVEVLKILATTVTVTETTYTVTQTSITQLPTPTVTESVIKITTATVTPKPSTVCGGQKPGVTISLTLPQATVTQTSLSYSTRHATGTVTVVSTRTSVTTNSRSATSCWLNGGWMGAD